MSGREGEWESGREAKAEDRESKIEEVDRLPGIDRLLLSIQYPVSSIR